MGRTAVSVQSLAAELERAEVATLQHALQHAEVIVLVASTSTREIVLDAALRDTWILDAGHPANAHARAERYARAGRAVHAIAPESDLPELLAALHYGPGEAHSCMVEAEVLAFEQRWEPFSAGRGQITPARAAEILALAERHGITPAPLRFGVD